MNSPVEPDSFEDASLKRVCRQTWSGEKCPLALLAKLKDAAKQSALQTVQPVQSMRLVPMWYSGGFGIAAAAAVLLTVGVVARPFARPDSAQPPAFASLDPRITNSIIDMHDRCSHKVGPHVAANTSADKIMLTGHVLETKLGQPILAASLPEGGWNFRGGAICPVVDKAERKVPAAHLIYKSGDDSVSVFSMPRSTSPCPKPYEGSYRGHPIAGFADANGAYCLVGSGSAAMTPQRIAAMRDRLQGSLVGTLLPPAYRQTVVSAELLQPIP